MPEETVLVQNTLKQISALLRERRVPEAEMLCRKLTVDHPNVEHGWIQSGRICQLKGDLEGMLAHAQRAVKVAPRSLLAKMQEAEASLLCGELQGAGEKLSALESDAAQDARIMQHIAELYTHLERHSDAMRCYKQARSVVGDDNGLLYNTATTATALGQMDEAEKLFDAVLRNNPHDYAAYYNRAVLRRQTPDNNHIEDMKAVIAGGLRSPGGLAQLGYALAKEYEDLGEYATAFSYLKQGAECRRDLLTYNVDHDVATMNDIKDVMCGAFFDNTPIATQSAGPIFILGQPRSGTTLVDRIISSHHEVESLGEINDFVVAFMKEAGDVKSKSELVRRTADMNNRAIGETYMACTRQRGSGASYLIDKTPANFLYIGLIAKALPNAKIIHLRRNPMDSCYAMYKTLFRMGYPYSYDLKDLGAYYAAYHGLMAHWRTQLPGRFLDVDYEELVADQDGQSRRIIAHCGLEWQDSCLDFHNNKSATATASAAQVRQPIYTSSVEKWRHYENELAPLYNALERAGILT